MERRVGRPRSQVLRGALVLGSLLAIIGASTPAASSTRVRTTAATHQLPARVVALLKERAAVQHAKSLQSSSFANSPYVGADPVGDAVPADSRADITAYAVYYTTTTSITLAFRTLTMTDPSVDATWDCTAAAAGCGGSPVAPSGLATARPF